MTTTRKTKSKAGRVDRALVTDEIPFLGGHLCGFSGEFKGEQREVVVQSRWNDELFTHYELVTVEGKKTLLFSGHPSKKEADEMRKAGILVVRL